MADSPRTIIDKLLAEKTGPEEEETAGPTADDPVGIAFHGIGIAHAVTAWGERTLGDGRVQLGITDSDDGVNGVRYFSWINGNTLNYYGRAVTVDYLVALRDSDEPGLNIGNENIDPPDLPAPEPASLLLLGTGAVAFIRRRRCLTRHQSVS